MKLKPSTKRVLRTISQVLAGLLAATPVFLSTSGVPQVAGAGATFLTVVGILAKVMNLVEDSVELK